MLSGLHVIRWSLGGTFAVIAGLAASAEPLAPHAAGPMASAALLDAISDVDSLAFEEPSWAEMVQPMSQAPMRPRTRALASVPVEVVLQTGASRRPEARPVFTAEAKWDGSAEGDDWSVAAMKAIDEAPHDLTEVVPADIGTWCPGYERNPRHLRAAFWVGTVSALARYESNFNPQAQGGGGAWQGLLQISPATARHYGCDATTPAELRDGEANLQCAIRIMSRTVTRDGVVSAGDEGIAADWGPMSNPDLREQMRQWVSQQSYCEENLAVLASLRPVARPDVAPTTVASLEPADVGIPMTLAFLESRP